MYEHSQLLSQSDLGHGHVCGIVYYSEIKFSTELHLAIPNNIAEICFQLFCIKNYFPFSK
jgi:hypothetical protein